MASHPYISGPRNITQMIGFLRKNFPATVTSDTVKRLGLASNNESYVINVLQFLGLIDEQGKRTVEGHAVMTKHDEGEFQSSFEAVVKAAYSDLFDLRADDAWSMNRDQLVGFFRSVDKTSDIIGGRQAGVFMALRELAGHQPEEVTAGKPKVANGGRTKTSIKRAKPAEQTKSDEVVQDVSPPPSKQLKGDMALTVRIEINLPAEGTQETYDAIFKSIRANLFP
ncbi:hypothetical protein PMI07_002890 [Rhizobium sp. CF080]|uniref:DUF5343 domain-containing protein n=1 Tax=Rhizobium sp. (strain CF080) TaxID=1144310 RepID=UPI00027178CE|nr:DUF5343 domain-containing protein [Rhizobium sp. CF080]EUB95112.1 hypothetical protein PMI07_002890 [Rhizobium sp. CF080]